MDLRDSSPSGAKKIRFAHGESDKDTPPSGGARQAAVNFAGETNERRAGFARRCARGGEFVM
jgi:hypothetical protein